VGSLPVVSKVISTPVAFSRGHFQCVAASAGSRASIALIPAFAVYRVGSLLASARESAQGSRRVCGTRGFEGPAKNGSHHVASSLLASCSRGNFPADNYHVGISLKSQESVITFLSTLRSISVL
jgi:hypothetical protein